MLLTRLSALLGAFAVIPLLASAASVEPASNLEARTKKPLKCYKGVKVIAARGDGTKPPRRFGKLITLATNITAAIPKSHAVGVHYNPGDGGYVQPSAEAIPTMTSLISDYVDACPDSKIVLAGYSLGAVITMNMICGTWGQFTPDTPPLDPKYLSNIIAIVIYGDETRVPGESYDEGSCTDGEGQIARTNADACSPYASIIKSYCVVDDPLCCQPSNPDSDKSYHFVYPDEDDEIATDWVVQQYEDATGTPVSKI